jgi:hypothetical protein
VAALWIKCVVDKSKMLNTIILFLHIKIMDASRVDSFDFEDANVKDWCTLAECSTDQSAAKGKGTSMEKDSTDQ